MLDSEPSTSRLGFTLHADELHDEQELIPSSSINSDGHAGEPNAGSDPASSSSAALPLNRHPSSFIQKELGEPVLSIRGVSKSFPISGSDQRVFALRQINLNDDPEAGDFYSIRRGEFVMIRGPSGGGKVLC